LRLHHSTAAGAISIAIPYTKLGLLLYVTKEAFCNDILFYYSQATKEAFVQLQVKDIQYKLTSTLFKRRLVELQIPIARLDCKKRGL
jgi:hypothetical protein